MNKSIKELSKNKKAFFDYNILEKIEAGMVLNGPEVKSVKNGQINLKGSYIIFHNNEAFLFNAHIAFYQKSSLKNYDPRRERKLLLHKKEITYLINKSQEKGLTVLPLRVYLKNGKIKLEIGIAQGRKKYDKRELIKKREIRREIERTLKRFSRNH